MNSRQPANFNALNAMCPDHRRRLNLAEDNAEAGDAPIGLVQELLAKKKIEFLGCTSCKAAKRASLDYAAMDKRLSRLQN